jgi:hypothetical protein
MEKFDTQSSTQFLNYVSIIDNATGSKQKYPITRYIHNVSNQSNSQSGGFVVAIPTNHSSKSTPLRKNMIGGDYDENALTADTDALEAMVQNKLHGGANIESSMMTSDTDKLEEMVNKKLNNIHQGGDGQDDDTEYLERVLMNKLNGGGVKNINLDSSSPFVKRHKKVDMRNYMSSNFESYALMDGGENDGLAIHREFIAYIQKKLGVKGGVALQKLGSLYKKKAKSANPSLENAKELTDKAQKLFDDDKNAKSKYDDIVKQMESDKKAKKAAKKSASASSYKRVSSASSHGGSESPSPTSDD